MNDQEQVVETSEHKGLLTYPDDFEIGQYYTIHSFKKFKLRPNPIAGLTFKLLAVQLPFVIGNMAVDGNDQTLDTRWLNLQKSTEEFYQIQAKGRQRQSGPSMVEQLFGPQRR